jgi:hypothetical protein
MTAARRLTAVLAVGVARLSHSNRIAADPRNAASIVAIERRPLYVDCVENVWPAPFARGFVEIGG